MKKIFLVILSTLLLGGCQALGDHFNCMAQVDRTVPAQTQQVYVRTDTKCNSSGSGIATPTTTRGNQYVINSDRETNCSSVPIYETIVLNQAQRDTAYQQCRARTGNANNASGQTMSGPYVRDIPVPDKERRMYCLNLPENKTPKGYDIDKLNKCIGQ